MKNPNFLSIALVAGSVGLWLIDGGVSAQPQPPQPDQVQKDVQQNAQKAQDNVQTEAEAKANAQRKNQTQADPDVRGRARANAERGTDAQADIDARGRARTDADRRGDARLDAEARSRAGADADRQGDSRIDAESDTDLGVQFDGAESDALTISSVNESGLAARAGLREGDRIVSIDGRRFDTARDINLFLDRNRRPRLPITFVRDGRRYSTALVWDDDARFRRDGRIRGDVDDRRRGGLLGTSFRDDARGVVLHDVHEGSPAHQAGLRAGDQIVCFNGWSYRSPEQFTRWINRFPRGRAMPVTYRRDGRLHSTRVTLDPRDSQTFAQTRGEFRDDRRMPPAPGDLRDGAFAERDGEGRRRAAFRPNYDEMSRDELQREVERLRRENDQMRRDLDGLRQNRGPASPDADIEAESDIDAESDLNLNDDTDAEEDIDAEADVDADAEIEGSEIDTETDVEVESDE